MEHSLFIRFFSADRFPSFLFPLHQGEPGRNASAVADTRHSLRVLGTVEAGFPSPAEEALGDIMSLDDFLIRDKAATYLLRVTGDSMREAGLLPGDLVLVERRTHAKDGDIVIAHVDGGWTMKYFRTRKGQITLEPANKKYRPIVPQEELTIAAVVIAAIRKY